MHDNRACVHVHACESVVLVYTFSLILQNSDIGIDTSSILIESYISLIVMQGVFIMLGSAMIIDLTVSPEKLVACRLH